MCGVCAVSLSSRYQRESSEKGFITLGQGSKGARGVWPGSHAAFCRMLLTRHGTHRGIASGCRRQAPAQPVCLAGCCGMTTQHRQAPFCPLHIAAAAGARSGLVCAGTTVLGRGGGLVLPLCCVLPFWPIGWPGLGFAQALVFPVCTRASCSCSSIAMLPRRGLFGVSSVLPCDKRPCAQGMWLIGCSLQFYATCSPKAVLSSQEVSLGGSACGIMARPLCSPLHCDDDAARGVPSCVCPPFRVDSCRPGWLRRLVG